MKIDYFTFQYKEETPLNFSSPDKAIKYFNVKGWGMHNWSINITFTNGKSTPIKLLMFNYLTDNWIKPKTLGMVRVPGVNDKQYEQFIADQPEPTPSVEIMRWRR